MGPPSPRRELELLVGQRIDDLRSRGRDLELDPLPPSPHTLAQVLAARPLRHGPRDEARSGRSYPSQTVHLEGSPVVPRAIPGQQVPAGVAVDEPVRLDLPPGALLPFARMLDAHCAAVVDRLGECREVLGHDVGGRRDPDLERLVERSGPGSEPGREELEELRTCLLRRLGDAARTVDCCVN